METAAHLLNIIVNTFVIPRANRRFFRGHKTYMYAYYIYGKKELADYDNVFAFCLKSPNIILK